MTTASCTLTQQGAVTTVSIQARVNVHYEFNTVATASDLKLPYAVAVNGIISSSFETRAKALSAEDRTIKLVVERGSKVSLFLNSDAMPCHRRSPVYEVHVGNEDVLVKIVERRGVHPGVTPTVGEPCFISSGGKLMGNYNALLTGDIWMAISHRYNFQEASALLPADLQQEIRDAVLSIYKGLSRRSLTIEFPSIDSKFVPPLHVSFDASIDQNARENISQCSFLTDVLPRVHPAAYAVLLQEAHCSGITELRFISAWRPMLGSITHRAGLALDVSYAADHEEKVTLTRIALTSAGGSGGENVTAKEKALHQAYVRAAETTASVKKSNAAVSVLRDTKLREAAAKKDWDTEREKNEPRLVQDLRRRLGLNKSVTQVLDPWYIDINTRDTIAPVPNNHKPGIEKIHSNHLHITIVEKGLP